MIQIINTNEINLMYVCRQLFIDTYSCYISNTTKHFSGTMVSMFLFVEDGLRVYGIQRHFQQYFSYIVKVSFIGGGHCTTCRKSLTNFIT
jgi:hypothetical protein